MKIEPNPAYSFSRLSSSDHLTKKEATPKTTVPNTAVDTAVQMELSERGLALAGELESFLDTYETTLTLLQGTGHIGSEAFLCGDFTETLAANYQNERQRIQGEYSGKKLEQQLSLLEKAYEEAANSLSIFIAPYLPHEPRAA